MRVTYLICWLAVAIGLGLLGLAGVTGLDHEAGLRAAGVVLIAVALWATGVLPEYLTAVIFFFVAMIFAVAPPEVVFSGFHSTAVWLVFGGVVIATAVQQSGLGARLVERVLAHTRTGYFALILSVALVGAGLAFLIPAAMGRVLLYVPLVVALAERLGFGPGTQGRAGLTLAAIFGTFMPAFAILPSNVPNLVLIGAAETILDLRFAYGGYLALNYPVMGLLTLLAVALITWRMFPDRVRLADSAQETPPWSGGELRLLGALVAALAFWITDFAHGISPAWIALGAALLCLSPRVGVLPPTAIAERINFGPWLFVAGTIGMGSVATHAGLGELVGEGLIGHLPFRPEADFFNFVAMVLVSMAVAMVTTLPAVPAIMTPLAEQLASASGWSLESVLMAQVPAWLYFPFPYEAPPLVVGVTLAGVSPASALRCLLAVMLTGLVVILPLQYLWGRLLGYYG